MSDAAEQREVDGEGSGSLDAADVSRTLAGESTAFDALIERYQRRAVAVSYRLLGNIDDAMDVCQDAFVRAFKSLDSLQKHRRFGAWLMRIVTNLSLNKRRARRPTLSLVTGDEKGGIHEDQLVDTGHTTNQEPIQRLQSAELEHAVSTAIDSLPEPQRLALILFAIEKISQKEVADILQCSLEMVKWNVFQARKSLKQKLAQYLQE